MILLFACFSYTMHRLEQRHKNRLISYIKASRSTFIQELFINVFFYYDFSHGPFYSSIHLAMINNVACFLVNQRLQQRSKDCHICNGMQKEFSISKQLKKGIIAALVLSKQTRPIQLIHLLAHHYLKVHLNAQHTTRNAL